MCFNNIYLVRFLLVIFCFTPVLYVLLLYVTIIIADIAASTTTTPSSRSRV
jgi:hypothetical protein